MLGGPQPQAAALLPQALPPAHGGHAALQTLRGRPVSNITLLLHWMPCYRVVSASFENFSSSPLYEYRYHCISCLTALAHKERRSRHPLQWCLLLAIYIINKQRLQQNVMHHTPVLQGPSKLPAAAPLPGHSNKVLVIRSVCSKA